MMMMIKLKSVKQHRYVGPPVMQRNKSRRDRQKPLLPFTLFCILCVGLAIIVMVVLALIPLYVKSPGITPQCLSESFSSILNIHDGILSLGQLSRENQIPLQFELNQYVNQQRGFSRCTVEVHHVDVDNCPSVRRILQKKRRRQATNSVRQTNDNCVHRTLTVTFVLNCGCTCTGVCLKRKGEQLNVLLRSISISVTFSDPITVTVSITGLDIPTVPVVTEESFSTVAIAVSTPTTTSAMITPIII